VFLLLFCWSHHVEATKDGRESFGSHMRLPFACTHTSTLHPKGQTQHPLCLSLSCSTWSRDSHTSPVNITPSSKAQLPFLLPPKDSPTPGWSASLLPLEPSFGHTLLLASVKPALASYSRIKTEDR
jgi:hypothetical protein